MFVELLTPGGPEIYLKPAGDYVTLDRPVNFYTVLEAARRKGQTAIGYRLLSEAGAQDGSFGVHLNPDKPAQFTLTGQDRIIVLEVDVASPRASREPAIRERRIRAMSVGDDGLADESVPTVRPATRSMASGTFPDRRTS